MARKLVDFGPDQTAAVERLAERFNRSQSDIVRAGVALLQIAVRETGRGNAMGIVKQNAVEVLTGIWSEATPIEPTAA